MSLLGRREKFNMGSCRSGGEMESPCTKLSNQFFAITNEASVSRLSANIKRTNAHTENTHLHYCLVW